MDILTYGLLNKKVEEAKNVSGEKITEAVNTYLDENPPTTGATAEQAAQIDKNVADIDELKTDLVNQSKGLNSVVNGVCDGKQYVSGGLLLDGNKGNYSTWLFFREIEVKSQFTHIIFNAAGYKGIISPLCFYDENKTFISALNEETENINVEYIYPKGKDYKIWGITKIPNGTKYISISSLYDKNGIDLRTYTQLSFISEIRNELTECYFNGEKLSKFLDYKSLIYNEWNEKEVCFLGDSITEGAGTTVGQRYLDYLSDITGMKSTGYGVDGAIFKGLLNQAQRMYSEKGSNVNAIFVFAGTNNFYEGTPLGEWYTESTETVIVNRATGETQERKVRTFSTDDTTLKGQINNLFSYLKHNYPDSQIILMTPIHRAYATFGDDNIQYSELYENKIGLYFNEYIEAIKEASGIWSVTLIDLYSDSGLFPLYDEYTKYFNLPSTDRLHPKALGHQRMAKVIANKLKSITCNFEVD